MLLWAVTTAVALVGLLLLAGYAIYGDPDRCGFSKTHQALLAEVGALSGDVRLQLSEWVDHQAPNATALQRLGGPPRVSGLALHRAPPAPWSSFLSPKGRLDAPEGGFDRR